MSPEPYRLSLVALICGILGFFTLGLASIAAVICARKAKILSRQLRCEVPGFAIGGEILGWIMLVPMGVALVLAAAFGIAWLISLILPDTGMDGLRVLLFIVVPITILTATGLLTKRFGRVRRLK